MKIQPPLKREIKPFEHLVIKEVCEGKTNAAIAHETKHSEKAIENTIARVAEAFEIKSGPGINSRVLLALAYRSYFGDDAFDEMQVACRHLELAEDGVTMICTRHQ